MRLSDIVPVFSWMVWLSSTDWSGGESIGDLRNFGVRGCSQAHMNQREVQGFVRLSWNYRERYIYIYIYISSILYCIVSCFIVLQYVISHSFLLYYTTLYDIILYCIVLNYIVLYCINLYENMSYWIVYCMLYCIVFMLHCIAVYRIILDQINSY